MKGCSVLSNMSSAQATDLVDSLRHELLTQPHSNLSNKVRELLWEVRGNHRFQSNSWRTISTYCPDVWGHIVSFFTLKEVCILEATCLELRMLIHRSCTQALKNVSLILTNHFYDYDWQKKGSDHFFMKVHPPTCYFVFSQERLEKVGKNYLPLPPTTCKSNSKSTGKKQKKVKAEDKKQDILYHYVLKKEQISGVYKVFNYPKEKFQNLAAIPLCVGTNKRVFRGVQSKIH